MQIVRYKNHSKKNLTAKLLKIYPKSVNQKTMRLYHNNISRSKGPIIILDTLPKSKRTADEIGEKTKLRVRKYRMKKTKAKGTPQEHDLNSKCFVV